MPPTDRTPRPLRAAALRPNRARRGAFVLALAFAPLALLGLPACGDSAEAGATATLRFAAIPDQNATELSEKYSQVAGYLAGALGVPVEYVPTSDYAASVEAFKNGDVQLAWFGGYTGVQAWAAVPGARAIATGRVDPEFVSYFIANSEAGIEPGEGFPMAMEGKRFTFGSESSTSGRLMPERFIVQFTGKTPEEFFGMPNAYSGDHAQTALQVQSGAFDCGALNYKVYDEKVAAGVIDPGRCVKVWTTPPYPDYNWTAHPLLEERYGAGFTERLKQAILDMDDPALLTAMQRPEGFIPATNDDFAAVQETMQDLGMLR